MSVGSMSSSGSWATASRAGSGTGRPSLPDTTPDHRFSPPTISAASSSPAADRRRGPAEQRQLEHTELGAHRAGVGGADGDGHRPARIGLGPGAVGDEDLTDERAQRRGDPGRGEGVEGRLEQELGGRGGHEALPRPVHDLGRADDDRGAPVEVVEPTHRPAPAATAGKGLQPGEEHGDGGVEDVGPLPLQEVAGTGQHEGPDPVR